VVLPLKYFTLPSLISFGEIKSTFP
jgi:hypothetical protein